MSIWKRREEEVFKNLPPDRKANIEIVSSAYASVFADKAYFTMPITTGKRYYNVLDQYGVKSVEELEAKRPGALRNEIIIPNIEEGKTLAAKIREDNDLDALIVPGIFEARQQRWTQEEYMVLWLRFISGSATAVFLSDGWEYSNGGATELVRGLALRNGILRENFLDWAEAPKLGIYNHNGVEVALEEGAHRLFEAIRDLDRRGYDTKALRHEVSLIEGMIYQMMFWDVTHSPGFEAEWSKMWSKIASTMETLNIPHNHALKGL